MKLTDLINYSFPDDEGYRLIDVERIDKEDNLYKLILTFQKLTSARDLLNSTDNKIKKKLKEFPTRQSIQREGNIAYARIFVVGSIWWNKGKPPGVIPNYLSKYSFDSKIVDWTKLNLCATSDFHEDQSMGIQYEDKNGNLKTRYPKVLCYELKEPVFHHKKLQDAAPLLSRRPPWESPIKTSFIAFHSYEVFRYFLTSSAITDLNDRLCNLQFRNSVSNELYDEGKSKEENGKHLVHLKKSYDIQDIILLGNLVYIPSFKETLRKVQNFLNAKSFFYFNGIEKLPVEKFSQMSVTAIKVKRKSDGAEGLLVLQIHSCIGYSENNYIPVIPMSKDSENSNPGINIRRGSRSKGKPTGSQPRVKNDDTVGMGSDTVNIDLHGFEALLVPPSDIKVGDPLFENIDDNGNTVIKNNKGENIFPPGSNPGGEPGTRPKNNIDVEPTNYFTFFSEIIKAICEKLRDRSLDAKATYMDENLIFNEVVKTVECRKLKIEIKGDPYPNWNLYLAEIKVVFRGEIKNFYLFEKHSKIYSAGRTWLYSFPKFKEGNETNLSERIKEFLNESKISSPEKKAEPDHKFNHLSSEKDEKGKYKQVKQKDAMDKHVEKITNKILKACGLKPLQ